MRRFLSVLFVFLFSLLWVRQVLGANQVTNSGFETGDLTSWQKTTSTTIAVIQSSEVFDGNFASEIETTTSSFIRGLEQIVMGVIAEESYALSGYVQIPELAGENQGEVVIRVAWYASEDGSGSQLSTSDSPTLSTSSGWTFLSESVQAPVGAQSAKVKLLVKSTNGQVFIAHIDDVTFELMADPVAVPELEVGTGIVAAVGSGGWLWWTQRKRIVEVVNGHKEDNT